MGNSVSGSDSEKSHERKNGVLFLLHRTWAVIVTEKWSKRRVVSDTASDYTSQYSYCSCSQCQGDDGFSSSWYSSELFESDYNIMAPNTQEITKVGPYPFVEDAANKQEKQRPPIYNPEDYALSLKKWGRKVPAGGLYTNVGSEVELARAKSVPSFRDYSNPMLMSAGSEMTLRQFGSVSELLTKLRADLRLAYPSFIQEFVADPLDGLTLLLELLRAIQLSQSNTTGNGTNTAGKVPPAVQRRALLDENTCLQCLLTCCQRYTDAIRKLTSSSAGLFALTVCIMSNVNKSRIIALQLLTKACDPPGDGHTAVSEALSTLRLRFGEPVRFRFLVGTLMTTGGQGELLAAGMEFINTFLDTSGSVQKRLYIQAELEQAGLDISMIKKLIPINSPMAEKIFKEVKHWEKKHVDVETLSLRVKKVEEENETLKDKVKLLERRVQILQEEKGILISLEQCLKDRCSELQGEVTSLKSTPKQKHQYSKTSGSNPAEDEGISSSERSLTPEVDIQRESSIYEMYSVQSETVPVKKPPKKEEEETTIDDVIEELKNIINDAETEHYRKQQEEAHLSGKVLIGISDEIEIVPSNLHPQPPRKARSLVHVYIPAEDYDCETKEIFFDNETNFTSDEGSDSLLSASRCQPQKKPEHSSNVTIKRSESFRSPPPNALKPKQNSFDGMFYVTAVNTPKKMKSKSLDRIDDGLDAMVDIVVTDDRKRNASSVFVGGVTHFGDEKQRMFLPPKKFELGVESPYYFPRVQEKRASNNSSFLIKRGHGNAGMYSGFVLKDNSAGFFKSGEFVSGNFKGGGLCGKVTDLPSGLY